jgi:tRNA-dihydrouridine synthase A
MATPNLVAECVAALRESSGLPVTVKCRTAIDGEDSAPFLDAFASAVLRAKAAALIVHSRRAYLGGLNPRKNLSAPPLDYARVYRLKRDFPDLPIVINGGISDTRAAVSHLQNKKMDGVMIGRAVVARPYLLAELAEEVFDEKPPTRLKVLAEMTHYAARAGGDSRRRRRMLAAVGGLFHGLPNARDARRRLAAGEWQAAA